MWRCKNLVRSATKARSTVWKRHFNNSDESNLVPVESLYVTSTDSVGKTAPVLLGLSNILEQKFSSVGYFRPITPAMDSPAADGHLPLMQSELELNKGLDHLYGVTNDYAIDCWLNGKSDELLDEILDKFEKCRQDHDFMIIEGSPIAKNESGMSWKMHAEIAKTIGSPVLLVSDFANQRGSNETVAREMAARAALGKDQVQGAGLTFFGSIANRVRSSNPHDLKESVKERFEQQGLPFLGFLPMDETIASKRLNEVTARLGAKKLFGSKDVPDNVVVREGVVATSHLKELFDHLKAHDDGIMVITSADRSDIMLGLLASRIPGVLPSVAGILLTNGDYPHSNTTEILKGVADLDTSGMSIPIYSVPTDTYSTAEAFGQISSDILPTSVRKISQCRTLSEEYLEKEMLVGNIDQGHVVHRSPKQFKHFVFNKARAIQRHIVLTEGEDVRVLQAADEVLRQHLAKVTILGNPEDIQLHSKQLGLDLSGANIVSPAESDLLDGYAKSFYEKRKHKGVTMESARDMAADETYFGTMMVEAGDADGMVSGACHTTANTIRPALQLIKTLPDRPLVSSIFFMCLEDGVRIYGDCAVNAEPSAEELAQIAITSAESAVGFNMVPRVALLSYATGDSNKGPIIDKVREATKMAQEMRPDLDIYGPIQYDAAVDASIAKTKLKSDETGAKVGGRANVLIFPDLNTGNNTYKAVQQSTQCVAMGPMLQGLRKPVNDLSRGATVKDIVTTVAITAIQADQMESNKA